MGLPHMVLVNPIFPGPPLPNIPHLQAFCIPQYTQTAGSGLLLPRQGVPLPQPDQATGAQISFTSSFAFMVRPCLACLLPGPGCCSIALMVRPWSCLPAQGCGGCSKRTGAIVPWGGAAVD